MHAYWIVVIFLFGACIGSFLNVVIYRLPRGESLSFPGSRCPACGRGIRWYDNIPILSWLALRGRCRQCKASISPRYVIIEAVTAVLASGLYVCYYILKLRHGTGQFHNTWPMFISHAALLCGLLVCTAVDLELWIIPLEVMWFCSLVGVAAAAFRPAAFLPNHLLPTISPALIAAAVAAVIGLVIAKLLVRWHIIQPSFLGVEPPSLPAAPPRAKEKKAGGGNPKAADAQPGRAPIRAVAITTEHGMNPRKEILREVLFLMPAIILSIAVTVLLRNVSPVAGAWSSLLDAAAHPNLAPRLSAAGSAVFGYVIGGLWIWGVRILGTLAFGKEAMGLGDAHILAAVGAVTGWVVPSLAFFVAPFLGLLWALYLWLRHSQRELPYGPWLASGTLVAMLFYDTFIRFLTGPGSIFQLFASRGTMP